jgi:hypothetical protein
MTERWASALAILLGSPIVTQVSAKDLFAGFAPAWQADWREQGFPLIRATEYAVVQDAESGKPVLHGTADNANRAMLRPLKVVAPREARLSWRWKVAAPLTGNRAERSAAGDDYAARVFVVFETGLMPTSTTAINYVWAGHEPVGSRYASPYTTRVQVIVLRSGETEAGQWSMESRDLLADYRAAFGRDATVINGVAVMVDTDNTDARAEAWFADLALVTDPQPVPER